MVQWEPWYLLAKLQLVDDKLYCSFTSQVIGYTEFDG